MNFEHQSRYSRTTNTWGNIWSRNDLDIVAPNSQTHYSNNANHQPNILDVAIIKASKINHNFENQVSDYFSNHMPIVHGIISNFSLKLYPWPTYNTNCNTFKLLLHKSHSSSGKSSNSTIINFTALITQNIVTTTPSSKSKANTRTSLRNI